MVPPSHADCGPWESATSLPAPASPWQNDFVERLIGSIRRECLIMWRSGARLICTRYFEHTRAITTHRSLNKDAPVSRSVQRVGVISSRAILGGLHHQYVRA
ncbi:MAG: integrase [Bradyrhizobium sp.]|uniref:integrase core domain-containing protein n=1 Tax=Bradyrhizobium sp. TaxID=376 RepID=UPI001206E163|nr:MAG: integrase [Bradyrhizobium sp.]